MSYGTTRLEDLRRRASVTKLDMTSLDAPDRHPGARYGVTLGHILTIKMPSLIDNLVEDTIDTVS